MPVPEFSLDDFMPYQLALLSAGVSRGLAKIYTEEFGISIPEWRVLFHVFNGGPLSVREVFQRVDMDKSKVSRAASRLEKSGLISKKINTNDRRLVELTLTPAGKKLMDEILPLAQKYERQILERLGDDAPKFREMLNRFLKETL